MIHEFKQIIEAYQASRNDLSAVLATVVALDGSSYRRPGVRMLILSDGKMIGAVSGGCVEKEIRRQAASVFKDKIPKMMTYDGRYRLGCEGILHILIEPFEPDDLFLDRFQNCIQNRLEIPVRAYYSKNTGSFSGLGSQFYLDNNWHKIHDGLKEDPELSLFEQVLQSCHRLIIIGAEHDAVQLCRYAAFSGWEVTVVASATEEKTIEDFPGATDFQSIEPDKLDLSQIDEQTSVVLMTHSYVKDLSFLLRLHGTNPGYLGLLGPESRREKLLNEFLEQLPTADLDFVESVHGPAGLDIGAETAQEIAISVMSEILAVYRGAIPRHLRDKRGAIHNS